jgi:copper chaperone CopZ
MKKIAAISLLMSFVFGGALAQAKKAVMTETIKTPTVQCESCKKRIEGDLSRVDGVQKVVVDFKRKTTRVTYVTDRVNMEYIKTAIVNLGYDADEKLADQDAYNRLPRCCKKPEDGGGMKKD